MIPDLPGNRHAADRLRRLLETGRVGHAYLFVGPDGVGKRFLALQFAAALAPRADLHVHRLQPDEGKASIPIEKIRGLHEWLSLKADHRRGVVVEPADAMTEEAQNALLKILEEPPRGVTLLLATAAPAGLLPTIRSRCQTVLFFPVPEPELRAAVRAKHGIDGEDLDLVVVLANGSLARADALRAKLDEEKERADRIFGALRTGDLAAAVEKIDRDEARAVFALLAAALRDRLAGRDTPLARRVAPRVDALCALEEVLRHEIFLGMNANVALTAENALLKVIP